MRKYIMDLTYKRYTDGIPDLLKQIRAVKKERQDKLASIQNELRTLDNRKLRSMAVSYTSEFLRICILLLQGSIEGGKECSSIKFTSSTSLICGRSFGRRELDT